MVASCCCANCTQRISKRDEGVTFHRFPKEMQRRKEWIIAVNRKLKNTIGKLWDPSKYDYVCSKHFNTDDFFMHGDRKWLKPTAVPSNFGYNSRVKKSYVKRDTINSMRSITICQEESPISEPIDPSIAIALDHNYNQACADELYQRNQLLMNKLSDLEKKCSNSLSREKRLRNKCKDLTDELKDLKLLSDDQKKQMKSFKDIPLDLFKRGDHNKYSDDMRKFALTLHLYGPKAYEYAKKVIPLPSVRTLRSWLVGIDAKPGFFTQSFTLLAHHNRGQSSDAYKYCCLVIDGMSIREEIAWDSINQRYSGFTDLGGFENRDTDTDQIAKDAIVLLAVGVKGYWKLPLGYFLCKGMSSDLQASIISFALEQLWESGCIPMALTFDGTVGNVKSGKLLGASLTPENLNPSFSLPACLDQRIFIILDACHMIKLLRNLLAAVKELYIPGEGVVRWQYIVLLEEKQRQEGLRLANRLSMAHINFENQKMKVSLAVQTLSSSVAKALQFLRLQGEEEFLDSECTERWILLIDRSFDILNSRSISTIGFKRAICTDNIHHVQSAYIQTSRVLLSMQDANGIRIVHTRRMIGPLGFVASLKSVLCMANIYIIQKRFFKYLITYKFSQDHIELLFSSIRRAGGWNNNPTAGQLVYIFRRILARCEVSPSPVSNITPQDGTQLLSNTQTSDFSSNFCEDEFPTFSPFLENATSYIAGWVVRKLFIKIACHECQAALVAPALSGDPDLHLIRLKNNGGLITPSKSVRILVKTTEKAMRCGNHFKFNCNTIFSSVLHQVHNHSMLFTDDDHFRLDNFDIDSDHKFNLIKLIVNTYFNLRQNHFAKCHNLESKKSKIRQSLTKTIIFSGQ